MRKYTGLNSTGGIRDFTAKSDEDAIIIARQDNLKCLIRVKSFVRSSPIYTILPYREEGY